MPIEFSAFPIATLSALGFYLVLAVSIFRPFRERLISLPSSRVGAGNSHLGGFDGYRGLAALFVAVGHMWYFTYPVFAESQLKAAWLEFGSAAVPVFCVLSGFLIYRSVASIVDIEGLRAYVIRRIFRVYPVYALGVFLCLIFGLYGFTLTSIKPFFADLFMMQVFWWGTFANPATWSLYHEIVFYTFMPLIFVTVGPKRIVLFSILGLVAMYLADIPSRDFGLYRYFLMGILASVAEPKVGRSAWLLFIVGLGILLFDLSGNPADTDWAAMIGIAAERGDRQTLGVGLGFALMLAATPHLQRVARVLELYPLRLLGTVSYSLFILHPFYILVNFPTMHSFVPNVETFTAGYPRMPAWYLPMVFAPGAVFWAIVAYKLLEEPGIALGKRMARRQILASHDGAIGRVATRNS